MAKDNMWDGLNAAEVKVPLEVLKEYADSFNNKFGSYVVLEIRRSRETKDEWASLIASEEDEPQFNIYLNLLVPSLKDYVLSILKITYLLSTPYPCKIVNLILKGQEPKDCGSSDQLDEEISNILVNEEFFHKVSMILAQVGFKG